MRFWEFLFVLGTAVIQISANECITPNGYRAQCQRLDDCRPLVSYIQRKPAYMMSSYERHFINMLVCYIDEMQNPFVCCAHNDPFFHTHTSFRFHKRLNRTNTATTTSTTQMPPSIDLDFPDPLKFECGSDIIKDRIVGGNQTEFGEYPWLALLEYEKTTISKRSFACGGSLVHKRYVLTAAHCITGQILDVKGTLVNVRLGEHTISSDPDCSPLDPTDCADPVINVGVERTIAHPRFAIANNGIDNDIGLIRLTKDIEMTTYIQPICFPTTDMNSPSGTKLFVSGWGRTENGLGSDIKLYVSVPIVSFTSCQRSLFHFSVNKQLQICAGGELNKDSCGGDSGGPLMVFNEGKWYLEGIVSFGATQRCGTLGVPGIYTRVNSYRAWVLNLIKSEL